MEDRLVARTEILLLRGSLFQRKLVNLIFVSFFLTGNRKSLFPWDHEHDIARKGMKGEKKERKTREEKTKSFGEKTCCPIPLTPPLILRSFTGTVFPLS